ncbi:MAG: integrase [Candidatus Paceibacterota bacterium]|jgi:transposase InsO family protein
MISLEQIREFAKLDSSLKLRATSKIETYKWINEVLNRFRYLSLRKRDKGDVRGYLERMTDLSQSQLTRIICKKREKGIASLFQTKKYSFPSKYNHHDIALLIETDNLHSRPSGKPIKEILKREYEVFKKEEYKNISQISASHIYNLRGTRQYESHSLTVKKTCAVSIKIGERRKPNPHGRPGFLRVDSVHQGDLEKVKGAYHINMVDEVTQWEIVGTVEKISEEYLLPLLEELLKQYPFIIINFHSDNGSEYINRTVARLLNKMMIAQTKSRSRHTNDNALAESKNGSVVRKHMGYVHIPKTHAKAINTFCKEYLNPYLNYHHPCGFATLTVDKRGKEKKKYDVYMTPYDKFKSLSQCEQYLKPGITLELLDSIAYNKSDNEFAREMKKAKEELFKNFKYIPQEMLSFTSFVSCSLLD